MTYPPQQPGQGGWGQQPAGNGFPSQGPQESPQQQPAWYGNQHTGWGQPGQEQPQQAPMAPQWGSEFGPGSWIQEPNGFADVEPPVKKKSKLPLILGLVGALVVLAGIGVGVYFLLASGPGEARPIAQQVVERVNAHDFNGVRNLFCQANRTELQSQLQQLESGRFNIRLGQVTERGEQATAQLLGTWEMGGASQPVDQTMGLTVENGEWKVCQLDQ
ncbi:Rv0361 family membrane protein [Saccharopolyspora sp. 5N708]|uniref:Rv0361 family membrane protein n=1 Tax=Saccharopolyspora sp. 5N708 TaxID=3457424 RepID=UPI003FD4A8CC